MDAAHPAVLGDLIRAVLAGSDLATLRREVVAIASHALAVELIAIWDLLPDQSTLVLQAGVGWQNDMLGHTTVEAGPRSPFRAAVQSSSSVAISNWRAETRYDLPSLLRERNIISSYYIGIGETIPLFGILSVDTASSRTFTGKEVAFLQTLADVLALAMDRGQLNEALARQVEGRTRSIEQQLVAAAQEKAILEERQRLARDLHDSVTQALYSITLHATAAQRLLVAGNTTATANNLRELQERAQEALDEMRLLIFELRPPVLEQVGLVAALQSRLNAVEGRANLETQLIVDGVDGLPSGVEEALYRISQEALNNALRHAHARHIVVLLRQEEARVMLQISDDGTGFDVVSAQDGGGMGLRGISERVARLGGQLSVTSAPGTGTRVLVEVVV